MWLELVNNLMLRKPSKEDRKIDSIKLQPPIPEMPSLPENCTIFVWIAAQISMPPWFLDWWLLPLNCTHLIETSLILKPILPESKFEMVGISAIFLVVPHCNHSQNVCTFTARTLHFYTLKTSGSAWPGKGSIGAKLHSESKMTRKLVSFLQAWQIMGSDWPSSRSHSASSWLISGSSLTRNGVWPQWTLSGSISDPDVFRV